MENLHYLVKSIRVLQSMIGPSGIGIDTVTYTHVPDVHVISTLCHRTYSFLVAISTNVLF